MTIQQKLINTIKHQAEVFLLDAGEFYPFGTYIDKEDCVVPVGVGSEIDTPASQELIEVLENHFRSEIANNYKLAALIVDVRVTENGQKVDGLQIRLFEHGNEVSETILKYIVNETHVEFSG
ncbi:hypothetical protein ACVW0P_001348 [Mucilaginibacter sp. UYNi724]